MSLFTECYFTPLFSENVHSHKQNLFIYNARRDLMMDECTCKSLVKELKKRGFIKNNRKFCETKFVRDTVFKGGMGLILYYKPALAFFEYNEICFILLHEEYHCITPGGGLDPDADEYAKKKIMEYDNKINVTGLLTSIGTHQKNYHATLHQHNEIGRLLWGLVGIPCCYIKNLFPNRR
jgi:hypothetical protein